MTLTPLQRDELRALVHRQDVAGAEAFVERLLPELVPVPQLHDDPGAIGKLPKPKVKGTK